MLAHEIRNPLSGIRGAAQLIEPALPAEDREFTRLICAETDRIRDLLDQMEVFSDDRPPQLGPVNLHAVLDHVEQLARAGFARGVAIRQEYDPSLPFAQGNRDQLVQVFLNLAKKLPPKRSRRARAGRDRVPGSVPAGHPDGGAGIAGAHLAAARGLRP